MSKFKLLNDLPEEEQRRILKELAPHARPAEVTFSTSIDPLPELGGRFPLPWNIPGPDGRITQFGIIQSAVPLPEIDSKLHEAVRTAAQSFEKHIARQVWGGAASDDQPGAGFTDASTYADGEDSPVSFDDVLQTIKELRRMRVERPYLEAIWFVHAPEAYGRFMDAFPIRRAALASIPVYCWNSEDVPDELTEHERALRRETVRRLEIPFDGLIPGVWLRISDGRVWLVEVEDLVKALQSGENTPD